MAPKTNKKQKGDKNNNNKNKETQQPDTTDTTNNKENEQINNERHDSVVSINSDSASPDSDLENTQNKNTKETTNTTDSEATVSEGNILNIPPLNNHTNTLSAIPEKEAINQQILERCNDLYSYVDALQKRIAKLDTNYKHQHKEDSNTDNDEDDDDDDESMAAIEEKTNSKKRKYDSVNYIAKTEEAMETLETFQPETKQRKTETNYDKQSQNTKDKHMNGLQKLIESTMSTNKILVKTLASGITRNKNKKRKRKDSVSQILNNTSSESDTDNTDINSTDTENDTDMVSLKSLKRNSTDKLSISIAKYAGETAEPFQHEMLKICTLKSRLENDITKTNISTSMLTYKDVTQILSGKSYFDKKQILQKQKTVRKHIKETQKTLKELLILAKNTDNGIKAETEKLKQGRKQLLKSILSVHTEFIEAMEDSHYGFNQIRNAITFKPVYQQGADFRHFFKLLDKQKNNISYREAISDSLLTSFKHGDVQDHIDKKSNQIQERHEKYNSGTNTNKKQAPNNNNKKFKNKRSTYNKSQILCRFFKDGTCKKANNCEYLHVIPPPLVGPSKHIQHQANDNNKE